MTSTAWAAAANPVLTSSETVSRLITRVTRLKKAISAMANTLFCTWGSREISSDCIVVTRPLPLVDHDGNVVEEDIYTAAFDRSATGFQLQGDAAGYIRSEGRFKRVFHPVRRRRDRSTAEYFRAGGAAAREFGEELREHDAPGAAQRAAHVERNRDRCAGREVARLQVGVLYQVIDSRIALGANGDDQVRRVDSGRRAIRDNGLYAAVRDRFPAVERPCLESAVDGDAPAVPDAAAADATAATAAAAAATASTTIATGIALAEHEGDVVEERIDTAAFDGSATDFQLQRYAAADIGSQGRGETVGLPFGGGCKWSTTENFRGGSAFALQLGKQLRENDAAGTGKRAAHVEGDGNDGAGREVTGLQVGVLDHVDDSGINLEAGNLTPGAVVTVSF